MLDIITSQGDASKSQYEAPQHISQNDKTKKHPWFWVLGKVQRNGDTTSLMGRQNCLGIWKTIWQFLTSYSLCLPQDVAVPVSGIYRGGVKRYSHTAAHSKCLWRPCLWLPKAGNHLQCLTRQRENLRLQTCSALPLSSEIEPPGDALKGLEEPPRHRADWEEPLSSTHMLWDSFCGTSLWRQK